MAQHSRVRFRVAHAARQRTRPVPPDTSVHVEEQVSPVIGRALTAEVSRSRIETRSREFRISLRGPERSVGNDQNGTARPRRGHGGSSQLKSED
jgi:hypothetical protein